MQKLNCLKKVEVFLTEVKFPIFIEETNYKYIALDTIEDETDFHSFALSIPVWLHKCKEEERKYYKGALYSFGGFAIDAAIETISTDVSDVLNSNNTDVKILVSDLKVLSEAFSDKYYLEPLRKAVTAYIDRIIAEYDPKAKLTTLKTKSDMTNDNNELIEGEDYLVWNGSIVQLCTLFHDLRTNKAKKGKVYLDYVPEQLVQFILKHFRQPNGEELSYNTIKTNLDPKREDKKAKADRLLITEE